MENVFGGLKHYESENWQVAATRNFNEEEINAVSRTVVRSGQFGLSVCFFMKGGDFTYIPISTMGNQPEIGSSIDLREAKLVTLTHSKFGKTVKVEL